MENKKIINFIETNLRKINSEIKYAVDRIDYYSHEITEFTETINTYKIKIDEYIELRKFYTKQLEDIKEGKEWIE